MSMSMKFVPERDDYNGKEKNLQLLMDLGKTLTSQLSLTEVLRFIMDQVNSVLKPKHWSLFLVDHSKSELYFCIAQGDVSDKIKKLRLSIGEGISGWVAKEGKPALVPDVRYDKRFSGKVDRLSNFQTKSIICVPLVARKVTLGVIELVNTVEDDTFTSSDLDFLRIFADFAAIAISNAKYYKKVKQLSLKDPLTICYNIRYLHEVLDRWIQTQKRFSMIFLDLDGFKKIVDTYGHQAGSNLLIDFSVFLRDEVRQLAHAGRGLPHKIIRYGGDEFIILLDESDRRKCRNFAFSMLDKLLKTDFLINDNEKQCVRLSASLGLAYFPEHARDKRGLMAIADRALFNAKSQGKGRVILADVILDEKEPLS